MQIIHTNCKTRRIYKKYMQKYKSNNICKNVSQNVKHICNTCEFSMFNDKTENICAGKYYGRLIKDISITNCEEWELSFREYQNSLI